MVPNNECHKGPPERQASEFSAGWQKLRSKSVWAKTKILSIVQDSWLRSRALHVPPPKLSDDQKKEFQHMFMLLDGDGSGAALNDHMHERFCRPIPIAARDHDGVQQLKVAELASLRPETAENLES